MPYKEDGELELSYRRLNSVMDLPLSRDGLRASYYWFDEDRQTDKKNSSNRYDYEPTRPKNNTPPSQNSCHVSIFVG